MEFLPGEINQYVLNHTTDESDLLKKINRDTNANVLKPRMLSGHLQGKVLSMLSQMIRPSVILEIGTYTGYSAIFMAEGLADDGKLITIDINEELEDKVRGYFLASGFNDKIQYLIGNALDIVPSLDVSYDLVFIDADKENYGKYYDMVIDKVGPGKFIIADNVLWSGKVVHENETTTDKDTRAIMQFNKKVQNDKRVENVLFPVRDGLMVIRKK